MNGRFVVDREIISGLKGRPPLRGTAIYEVDGKVIKRVWFLDR